MTYQERLREYEKQKRKLIEKKLEPDAYELAIRLLAQKLKI